MNRFVLSLTAATLLVVPLLVASAGTIVGPGTQTNRIAPRDEHRYGEIFIGGEMAQVRVKGYGRSALLVEVFDANGNRVAATTDAGGEALLTWYPHRTEQHTIVVTNVWPNWQTYFISCN
jgi:hypothetical protein